MSNSVKVIKYGNSEKGADNSVERGNIELLMKVTAQAKQLSPWLSGILRNSIMWKTDKSEGGHEKGNKLQYEPKKGEGVVGSATEYAASVEFGTRHQTAQPYLRPAVQLEVFGSNGANTMKDACVKEMKEALSKGKKTI